MLPNSARRIGACLIFVLVVTACSPATDQRDARNDNSMLWILGGVVIAGLLVTAAAASCSQARAIPTSGGGLAYDPGTC